MFDVKKYLSDFFENRKTVVICDEKTEIEYAIKCRIINSNQLIMFFKQRKKEYTYSLTSNNISSGNDFQVFINVDNETLLDKLSEYITVINKENIEKSEI